MPNNDNVTELKQSAARTVANPLFFILLAGLLLAGMGGKQAGATPPGDELQARYVTLQDQLAHNAFHRPLYLESKETPEDLQGDIYAVMEQPYETVRESLQAMEHWCDILILHPNVKGCRVLRLPTAQFLKVSFGKKHDEPLDKTFPVEFAYRVAVSNAGYLHITLHAETGPLGTSNYRIAFEAVPLASGRTFIHLAYSYDYGLAARLAMKGYLTTLGSGKVGFSVTEPRVEGESTSVGGVRGVVERNTMRYYLAIDAYLASLAAPPAEQLALRLQRWFAATELYRRQLHEIEETEYLAMKRKEVLRQQSGNIPALR